jgi:hypothetical protein
MVKFKYCVLHTNEGKRCTNNRKAQIKQDEYDQETMVIVEYKNFEMYCIQLVQLPQSYKKKKNCRLSPQANYTDRATAAVGEVVPTFADRGVLRGQRNGSPRLLISVF